MYSSELNPNIQENKKILESIYIYRDKRDSGMNSSQHLVLGIPVAKQLLGYRDREHLEELLPTLSQPYLIDQLIQLYAELFINRWDAYYKQVRIYKNKDGSKAPDGYHGWRMQERELTISAIRSHVNGQTTIGLIGIDKNGCSKFCAWDNDRPDNRLQLIQQQLNKLNIGSIKITGRPGRPGHLFVLFSTPVHAFDLHLFRQEIESRARIDNEGLDFFPYISDKDPFSPKLSNIRAPLGINRKIDAEWSPDLTIEDSSNFRGWFEDAPKATLPQLISLLYLPINDPAPIIKLIEPRKRFQVLKAFSSQHIKQNKKMTFIGNKNTITALEMLKQLDWKLIDQSDRYVARCPLCRDEGHDTTGDNLHLAKDGTWFGCWYKGWSQEHQAKDIYKRLGELTGGHKEAS